MKKVFTSIAVFLLISLSISKLAFPDELVVAKWSENNPCVEIYDDPQGIGFDYVNYDKVRAEDISVNDSIRLLMINGGFVPNPGIIIENGRTLVPVRIVSEILGANVEWNAVDKTVKITDSNTDVLLTIDSKEANVNGDVKTLDVPARIFNSLTYVPLRFISETLNAEVQYVPKLNYEEVVNFEDYGTWILKRNTVSVVAIEQPNLYEKEFTIEEGLMEVKKSSAETYEELLMTLKAIGNDFSETQKDYDSQAVYYINSNVGRYYIYVLEGFEEYPIWFNKYTGEIFSEQAGLPFTRINRGFINIPWIYQ